MTRRLARFSLLTLAGVLTIVAGRQFVTYGADVRPSTPSAVLTSGALHGPQALADRPSQRMAPVGFEILVVSAFGLALALLAGWAARELTEHRSWAIVDSLRCRRRGPPVRFTV